MVKKKRQQSNILTLSSLQQNPDHPRLLKRKLMDSEEKYQRLKAEYEILYNDYFDIEKKLDDSEEKYQKLYTESEWIKEKLSFIESDDIIEKFLKNEAYAFLLSENLLDKFLVFREATKRTKTQETIFNLVIAAELTGLWIE